MKTRLLIFLLLLFTSVAHAWDNSSTDLEPITSENAAQIEQLNILGYGLISGLSWSPDAKTVAVSGTTGVILYDAEKFDQAPYRRLDIPEPVVYDVAYSPDGEWLATLSGGGRVDPDEMRGNLQLWNTSSWTVAAEWWLEIKGEAVNDDYRLTFSPGGQTLVVTDYFNAYQWDIRDVNRIAMLPTRYRNDLFREWYIPKDKHLPPIDWSDRVYFSGDGKLIARYDRDTRNIELWDVDQDAVRFTFEPQDSEPYRIYFSPDNRLVVSVELTEGGTPLRVWDVQTGEQLNQDHPYPNLAITFEPHGSTFLLASNVSNIQRWDAMTHRLSFALGYERQWWFNNVNSVAFSPDGETIAAGRMTEVELWDVKSGVRIASTIAAKTSAFITRVSYSSDGRFVAAADEDGFVRIWDADNLHDRAKIEHFGGVTDVAFSPDGKLLATYSDINSDEAPTAVFLWSLDDLLKRGSMQEGDELAQIFAVSLSGTVSQLVFSPDSKTIALTGMGIELWDVQEVLRRKADHISMEAEKSFVSVFDNIPGPIAISPDSQLLATVTNGKDCSIVVWEIKTHLQQACAQGHRGIVTSVVFSPDGKLLATSSREPDAESDNTVRIWDAETGRQLNVLTGHYEDVWQVVFSPDGKLLASASGGCYDCPGEGSGIDGTVRLWGVPNKSGK